VRVLKYFFTVTYIIISVYIDPSVCVARNLRMSCDVGVTRKAVIHPITCQNRCVSSKKHTDGTMSAIN